MLRTGVAVGKLLRFFPSGNKNQHTEGSWTANGQSPRRDRPLLLLFAALSQPGLLPLEAGVLA